MPSFTVELPDDTARGLAVEADLLGFDSPAEYLQWLVSRRFDIDDGGERAALLDAYADRATEMDLNNVETPPVEPDIDAAPPADSVSDALGSNLQPRVKRIEDDRLADSADALSSVEGARLDEFARRAVADTRERLGDSVGSGIDYSSRNGIGADRRLGEDIADLDSIEVPGWEEDIVERRRRAVGAALALLKDAEAAKRNDFVSELYEEFPAEYDSTEAWWECIKQGLRQVDRVVPARDGEQIWRFRTTPGRVRRISYER